MHSTAFTGEKPARKTEGGGGGLNEHASGVPSVARQLCTGGPRDGHAESRCSAFSFHHFADGIRAKMIIPFDSRNTPTTSITNFDQS